MANCKECGKKLGMIHRFYHPVLGKEHFVCSTCLLHLDHLIEDWNAFIQKNSTYIDSLNIDGYELQNHFEQMVGSFINDETLIQSISKEDILNIKNFDDNISILSQKGFTI